MPLTSQLIDAAVERYWRECDRYQKLAELYERGWQLRFRRRQVEVLRNGREEPRTLTETE